MDAMVREVQIWLNVTYQRHYELPILDEDGITGWATVRKLIQALQIEIGLTPDGDFGPGTLAVCPTLYTSTLTSNLNFILQSALYCKGFNPNGFDGAYGSGVAAAITKFKANAGLPNPSGITTPMVFKALLNMDAYLGVGDLRIKDTKVHQIQQTLNNKYSNTIGLVPTDGNYTKDTNKAIVQALQIEEGQTVADGVLGPTTISLLPTLSSGNTQTAFILLLQFSLYVNGFDPNGFDGKYGNGVKNAVSAFQTFVKLAVDGIAGKQVWSSLLVSTGDKNRKGTACDCVTTITTLKAQTLKQNGYKTVGRYLVRDWKRIKQGELDAIFGAGLTVFPIYQRSGDGIEHFNEAQGASDARDAHAAATGYGFNVGTIIYFAVDFDAVDGQVTTNIIPYFRAVYNKMQSLGGKYRIGIYGPRNVCSRVFKERYAVTSFVSDMSTKFSGNLGYPLPNNWAFDQISTISIGAGDGAIEIDNNIQSGLDMGVSSVAILNPLDDNYLLSDYTDAISNEVVPIVSDHLSFAQELITLRSPQTAVNVIFQYDELITQLSQKYNFRKAMLQSVVLRELSFENVTDVAADAAVKEHYAYKEAYEAWLELPDAVKAITPAPTYPILGREDASTGFGQIFAKTAIDSINYAVNNGIASGNTYNYSSWKDVMYIWTQLNSNVEFNLATCALVLLRAANQVELDSDYYGYTETDIKKVLSRYNGTNDAATNYGNETFKYYQVFEKYNKLVREHSII